MTYRLLLWFDMLEEEGKSTESVRRLFTNRMPPLSKDLSTGTNSHKNGNDFGGGYINGNGFGDDHVNFNGNGYGDGDGTGTGTGWFKIMVVKI